MLLEKQLFLKKKKQKKHSVSVRQVLQQAPQTSVELLLNCSEKTEERVEIL